MQIHRGHAALCSLCIAVIATWAQPVNAQVTYVDGKRYMLSEGKLYPQVRNVWKELNGKEHETWITDYSSWIAPKTKTMSLPPSKPMSVKASVPEKESRPDFTVKDEGTKHYITLNADVLFDFNKFNLNQKAEKVMEKLSPLIKQYGSCTVSITGHTDSIGSDEYNQTLSEQRASSVKEWLEQHQVVSGNATTSGMGKRHPVAPNTYLDGSDCPIGRARNRRVEIVVDTAAPESTPAAAAPATDTGYGAADANTAEMKRE